MSYETMLALRNMECEKNRATRMQVCEKEKRLSDAYTTMGNVSLLSAGAGALLDSAGMEYPAIGFFIVAALCVASMIKKYEIWRDFCDENHV